MTSNKTEVSRLPLSIDSDIFLRSLLRELSGTLEEVVGLTEAAGFVSIVGQHIGEWMDREYRKALCAEHLSQQQVSDVLVDLKKRINGDFYVISADHDRIVLGNRYCPFGDKVLDRTSLCMMTSNVFGTISAENLGYAKVCLHNTIAGGDKECKVTIHINHNTTAAQDEGREYYKT